MSELIAEARVLIRPDLTGFRAALEAEVLAASKGVTVPVRIAPVAGGTGTAAAAIQAELASQTAAATSATVAQTEALTTNTTATTRNAIATAADADAVAGATAARERGAAALASQNRALAGVAKGAGSAAAGLLGVRGATLAATAPFLAGAAGAITLTKAIQGFASLQSELNVFAVTAGASADEMARVREEAQQLGRDITLPAVGAQDAAEAMTELSKAGLSVQDSLDGARGVLQLATAAAISNADAVQIAASALNAFGLSGDQAVRVADVLTNASNLAQGSILDVGLALQQAAAVAKQVGLSFEDTVALITELQKAGIRGSDAGTSLRVSLIKLIAPSKQAAEVLDKLNVQIRDSAGNVRPDVFNQFAAAQANLTRKQQDANAAIVFGTDGLRAYSIIARQGLPALRNVTGALGEQGSAAKLAGARMAGLAGDVENLKNQFAALGITIGKVGTGFATPVVKGLTNFVESLNTAFDKLGKSINPPEFKEANANFDELVHTAERLQETLASGRGGEFTAQLAIGFSEVTKELERAARTKIAQGFLNDVIESFIQLSPKVKQAMEDNVITPSEQAALAADPIGQAFLAVIPKTDKFFKSFALGAKSGIEDTAAAIRAGAPTIAEAARADLEDAGAAAKAQAATSGKEVGDAFFGAIQKSAEGQAAALAQALAGAVSTAAQSATDLAVARAEGNQPVILRILLEQRRRQQVFLDRVLARQPTTPKEARRNVALQKEAAQQLEDTKAQITAIFDARNQATKQAASDAKSKADAAAKALADAISKADQKILDGIEAADTRFERAVEVAQAQGGPGALVKALTALQAQQQRDIDRAKATIKDQKTLQSTLRQLRADRFQTGLDLAAAQQAQQQAIEESFQKRLTFAELQAQLTGNDTVLVKAINAYIKYLRTVALPAAQKARKGVIDVKTEIERLLVQRKELANTVSGESPDVFAARLFQQAADQFRRFGSNIASTPGGLLSPQAARGQFAANLLGPSGQDQAVRQRDAQLAETKKQTAILQVIARGPRREIKGVTVPRAAQEQVAIIAANVLRGL